MYNTCESCHRQNGNLFVRFPMDPVTGHPSATFSVCDDCAKGYDTVAEQLPLIPAPRAEVPSRVSTR